MTVRIVVDSTSDIGLDRAKEYGIEIVPLKVIFGEQEYLDGINLDTATFYQKLQTSPVLPKTSTPSVAAFEDSYRTLIKEGATGILSIHISGALSGTHNTATLAAMNIAEESSVPIKIIDSRTVSVAFGAIAIMAAQRAHDGASLADLELFTLKYLQQTKLYFLLDTLEYLEKGGRIGRAAALMGTLLSIKPILTVKDGIITPFERIRTRPKALHRLGELVHEAGDVEYVAIVASDDQVAEEFKQTMQPVYHHPIDIFKLGAVIGTHAGPRAAGIVIMSKA